MKLFVIESSAGNSVLMGLAGLQKSSGRVDLSSNFERSLNGQGSR